MKIEVFDAERFNEEIFLGEVSLLISNFLVPKKLPFGPGANRLTPIHIKGIFPLNKIQATDRVSGSISLDAYLHFPDPQYLANVINIQRKSSNISLAMKLSNSLDLNSIMGYNGNEIFQNGGDERSLFSENSFRDLSVMQSNSLPPERMISMQSRSLIEDTSIHSVGNPKVTNAVANSLGSPERTTSVLGTSSGEKKSQQSKVELKRLAAKFNANISNRQRNNLLRETELNSQISLDDNSSLYLKSQLDHPLSKENSPTMIENPAFLDIRVSRNLRSYSSPAKMIKSESSYHNGRNDATLDLNPSMLLSPMRPDLKQVSSPNSLPNSASGKIQATPESVQLNNQQRSTVSEISSGNVLSSFQRRTRLADLSKCLDTLSSDIKSADAVIGDLNRKLEGKVETRIS